MFTFTEEQLKQLKEWAAAIRAQNDKTQDKLEKEKQEEECHE